MAPDKEHPAAGDGTKVPGTQFYSLQTGAAAQAAANWPEGACLVDCSVDPRDFQDTAALIANLDLVIRADTAVAHLAGALGRPVVVLLPYVADWRWFDRGNDTPWYPSLTLCRQPRLGDWPGAVAQAVAHLAEFAATGNGQR